MIILTTYLKLGRLILVDYWRDFCDAHKLTTLATNPQLMSKEPDEQNLD